MKSSELITDVKKYLDSHYDEGWDTIVECWDTAELADAIKGARTLKGAIKKLRPFADAFNSHRDEVEATIW